MAKIRFWKWQLTDELGLPSVTRFPISDLDLDRKMAGHLEQNARPPETKHSEEVADRAHAGRSA